MEDMKEALDKEEQDWKADLEKRDAEISELRNKLDEVNAEYARENGQEPRRGGRRRSPSAAGNGAGKDRMEEDDASALPGRAPLPERDDLEDDRGLGDYEEDSRDTAMQGAEGEEDVPACESAASLACIFRYGRLTRSTLQIDGSVVVLAVLTHAKHCE